MVKIMYKGSCLYADIPMQDESCFWKAVSEQVMHGYVLDEDGMITVETEDHRTANIKVTVTEGRAEVKPARNKIHLPVSLYGVKKLRKIDAEAETHLFYDIVPNNMGQRTIDIGARYGQTGGTTTGADLMAGVNILKPPYPSWFYWMKYYLLLQEGYQDMTDELYDEEEEIAKLESLFRDPIDFAESVKDDLVLLVNDFLEHKSRQKLSEQMNIDWLSSRPPFNRRQISSAWKAWRTFSSALTAETANEVILNLIGITDVSFKEGKSKKKVSDFLVKKSNDPEEQKRLIGEKVDEWESIIRSMEAVLPLPAEKKGPVLSPFGNIGMKAANKEETERIRKLFRIPEQYAIRYVEVDAPDFKKRFEDYCKSRGIGEEGIRELCHGSSTANFKSIISNGLVLYPDAPAHGKAYDWGIYFALDFIKARGYTDLNGSLYAHGTQDVGIVGVYRTAYGKPMYPTKGRFGIGYKDEVEKGGYDCLHAKAEISGYRMDEIVFYHEESVYLEGLIFFAKTEDEAAIEWVA